MTRTAFQSDLAETEFVDTPSGRFAYRRLGKKGATPLVLCMRFRGTIDHWDPALLDIIGAERDLVLFDNRGTAASTGITPTSVDGLADGTIEFVEALGLTQVDLLGWSLGGYVAQAVALSRPDLVRRLIVAGSGPGGVPDQPKAPEKVWQVAPRPENVEEDFLYLFFPETDAARRAGVESLRRLDHRLLRPSHMPVAPDTVRAQTGAIRSFQGFWDRVPELCLPVLVANGGHDVMIHAYASYAMSQRLPLGKLVLYSDAGHGFLFHHANDFGHEILEFLR